MAAFLLCSVRSTRRCSVAVASGLFRNLLHHTRSMASRSGSDHTSHVLYNQSRPPADSPGDAREIKEGTQQNPNDVLSSTSSSSKAHLYVGLATALKSPPGTFKRKQMFEIWCKNFPKSYDSEKEKLHRFKLFNYFLDHEIENKYKYSSSSSENMPTLSEEISDGARPDEISSPYHDQTEVGKLAKTVPGENKEEARKLEEIISRLEAKFQQLENKVSDLRLFFSLLSLVQLLLLGCFFGWEFIGCCFLMLIYLLKL